MRALLLCLFAAAGCMSSPIPDPIHLSGTAWIRVDDTNASPHNPTLQFSDHRATGYTGCNTFFAAVTQDGEKLRFAAIGTTRRACDAAPARGAEQNMLAALAATRYGHYDQDALVLLDERQQQVARFERDTTPRQ